MRRFIFVVFILFAVILISILAGIIIGKHRPSSPFLISSVCGLRLCWHGANLAGTVFEDAQAIFSKNRSIQIAIYTSTQLCWIEPPDEYLSGCIDNDSSQFVKRITFYTSANGYDSISLGEIIEVYGTPYYFKTCLSAEATDYVVVTYVYFSENLAAKVYNAAQPQDAYISLTTPVVMVIYQQEKLTLSGANPWHGFITVHQLEPCTESW